MVFHKESISGDFTKAGLFLVQHSKQCRKSFPNVFHFTLS